MKGKREEKEKRSPIGLLERRRGEKKENPTELIKKNEKRKEREKRKREERKKRRLRKKK